MTRVLSTRAWQEGMPVVSNRSVPSPFTPAPFFVLRTPALSLEELLSLGAGTEFRRALDGDGKLEEAVRHDRALVRERLAALLERPRVREAIWLASPSLYRRIDRWRNDPGGAATTKIERSLLRYCLRMCARTAPFGLFAGCALGRRGPNTSLSLAPGTAHRRRTTLDSALVCEISSRIARDHVDAEGMRYVANSTLYRTRERVSFVARGRAGADAFCQTVLRRTRALDVTLEAVASPSAVATVVEVLGTHGIARDEGALFVRQAIEAEVIVPEIAPVVTGQDPLVTLAEQLSRQGLAPASATALRELTAELAAIDALGCGVSPHRYRGASRALSVLLPERKTAAPWHAVLVGAAPNATIGEDVVVAIERGVDALARITARPQPDRLHRFREDFERRWGERAVPLLALFHGQRSGSNELEGLALDTPTASTTSRAGASWLLRPLERVWSRGDTELVLTEHDLDAAAAATPRAVVMPDAFAAAVTVLPGPTSSDASAPRVALHVVSGPSGATLLGRFCGADDALAHAVRRHLRDEEALAPDAIFAEIAHLPVDRAGNVLARPLLRRYEIPVFGRSGCPLERQIPLSDLLVRVEGTSVRLWSQRLEREVIPRSSCAHVPAADAPVHYRFLHELQYQGEPSGFVWDWGVFADAAFLPRVRYRDVLLSRASWNLAPEEIESLIRPRGASRWVTFDAWRRERRLPRQVLLIEEERETLFDLDNVLCIDALLDTLRGRDGATLAESLCSGDRATAHATDGRYSHEAIVPFVVQRTDERRMMTKPPVESLSAQCFTPGSDWLYVKIYAIQSVEDTLLRSVLGPLVTRLADDGTIDRWHFLRYSDPDAHLRVRFHGERQAMRTVPALVQDALAAELDDGLVMRLLFDTYHRELTRYGEVLGCELAERVFHLDSAAMLRILRVLADEREPPPRWQVAALVVDALFADFGLGLGGRLAVARAVSAGLRAERMPEADLAARLSRGFRQRRRIFEGLIADQSLESGALCAVARTLSVRSEGNVALAAAYRSRIASKPANLTVPELVASFVHMSLNRLFAADQRAHELVLLDALQRVYHSFQVRGGVRMRHDRRRGDGEG